MLLSTPRGIKVFHKQLQWIIWRTVKQCIKASKEIIILGDFNIDYNKADNRDFKSLLNIFRLKQVITEPTRTTETSSTLIDLIITNRPENKMNKGVFPNSIADHDMIACLRKINNICYNPKMIKCRNYTNYSLEELKSNVAKTGWSPVYEATNFDLAVSM